MAQNGNDHLFSNHRSNALSLRPGRHHIHAPSLRIGQSITDAVMINRRAPEKFEFSQKRCEDASHSNSEVLRETSTSCEIKERFFSFCDSFGSACASSRRFRWR